jgi:hypothetical protein
MINGEHAGHLVQCFVSAILIMSANVSEILTSSNVYSDRYTINRVRSLLEYLYYKLF